MADIEWLLIPGGVCLFGDKKVPVKVPHLLWAKTLITFGACPEYGDDKIGYEDWKSLPVAKIDYYQADEIARKLGGRLPRSSEWEWMAIGAECRNYPWGDSPWTIHKANLRSSGIGRACGVGLHVDGATPEGILDVAGNLWEWTATSTQGNGKIIRGGSYSSTTTLARAKFLNAAPIELRSHGIGVRPVRDW